MEESHTLSIKLSLDKLQNLLEREGYILEQVYCHRQHIIFAECRTPKYQKTFIVYIPDRYSMEIPHSSSLKRLNIIPSDSPPTPHQIKFMSDIKGPLLECDLLSVSSEILCLYLNSGNGECFYIKDENESESEDESEDSDDRDNIDLLERDAVKLLQKLNPKAKLPKAVPRKKKSEDEEKNELESIPNKKEEEGKVELFFEDENGYPVDEVKSILENPSNVEDSLNRIKEKIESKDNKEEIECDEEQEEEYSIRDNSLPPVIEEGEVTLGIVYVLIDIRTFFKTVSEYEDSIINSYNQIDDNEEDMKKKKLTKVKELCHNLISHSEKKLKEISEEEEKLKDNLLRLTVVLTQGRCLMTKVKKDPSKYGQDVVEETTRIYKETRTTIYELNMEILKLRDTSEELLSNYKSSIQELLEL